MPMQKLCLQVVILFGKKMSVRPEKIINAKQVIIK